MGGITDSFNIRDSTKAMSSYLESPIHWLKIKVTFDTETYLSYLTDMKSSYHLTTDYHHQLQNLGQ